MSGSCGRPHNQQRTTDRHGILAQRHRLVAAEDGGGPRTDRAPAAYDDVVLAAHDGSCVPACSATMYSAYQSGQSSSRWPVRFSCSPCAADARRIALARSEAEAKLVAFES